MLRCITEMKRERGASCSTGEGAEQVLVWGFLVCVYSNAWAGKPVYMQNMMHNVYSIACFCVHVDRFQSTDVFISPVLTPSKQEEYSSHLQKSGLLHFLPWHTIDLDSHHKGGTAGVRMQMEEGIRLGGPCSVRKERKRRPPSRKCLYLCLNDWRVSQNPGSSAPLGPHTPRTQIHPGPYHLEDIMGNAWRGSSTPSERRPPAVLTVALINWSEHLWGLAAGESSGKTGGQLTASIQEHNRRT